MNVDIKSSEKKSLVSFFGLVFLISSVGYLALALAAQNIFFPKESTPSMTILLAIAPIGAALILSYKKDGSEGSRTLLKRTFDYKRILDKKWLFPIFFFIPIVYMITFLSFIPFGAEFPSPLFDTTLIIGIPIMFLLFFVFALLENVGWMGYIYDEMEDRWRVFKASLVLGIIWEVWHIPLDYFIWPVVEGGITLGYDHMLYILGMALMRIGVRFFIIWIYTNTGRSVFATIVSHAIFNVCIFVFVPYNLNSQEGFVITGAILLILTLIITYRSLGVKSGNLNS